MYVCKGRILYICDIMVFFCGWDSFFFYKCILKDFFGFCVFFVCDIGGFVLLFVIYLSKYYDILENENKYCVEKNIMYVWIII